MMRMIVLAAILGSASPAWAQGYGGFGVSSSAFFDEGCGFGLGSGFSAESSLFSGGGYGFGSGFDVSSSAFFDDGYGSSFAARTFVPVSDFRARRFRQFRQFRSSRFIAPRANIVVVRPGLRARFRAARFAFRRGF